MIVSRQCLASNTQLTYSCNCSRHSKTSVSYAPCHALLCTLLSNQQCCGGRQAADSQQRTGRPPSAASAAAQEPYCTAADALLCTLSRLNCAFVVAARLGAASKGLVSLSKLQYAQQYNKVDALFCTLSRRHCALVVAGKLEAASRGPADLHLQQLQHKNHTAQLLMLCFVLCHDRLVLLW